MRHTGGTGGVAETGFKSSRVLFEAFVHDGTLEELEGGEAGRHGEGIPERGPA